MTVKKLSNLAPSVQARLQNHARATKRPFQELLQYDAMERFLYRLSTTPHRARFVLKGALMLGYVHLHRGIGDAKAFRFWGSFRTGAESRHTSSWEKYVQLQFDILSRSDLSFNSIHDRAKRVETGHINDDTWMTDDLAAERGLDIDRDAWTRALWEAAHQSFALRRWVSENKFGPHRVVFRTPLTNIRITTFFAGEHEVRVLDPSRLELLAAVGCKVTVGG